MAQAGVAEAVRRRRGARRAIRRTAAPGLASLFVFDLWAIGPRQHSKSGAIGPAACVGAYCRPLRHPRTVVTVVISCTSALPYCTVLDD